MAFCGMAAPEPEATISTWILWISFIGGLQGAARGSETKRLDVFRDRDRFVTSSRQGGTSQALKKASEAWSIQREKLGKKTMPAGSQSPKCTSTTD